MKKIISIEDNITTNWEKSENKSLYNYINSERTLKVQFKDIKGIKTRILKLKMINEKRITRKVI